MFFKRKTITMPSGRSYKIIYNHTLGKGKFGSVHPIIEDGRNAVSERRKVVKIQNCRSKNYNKWTKRLRNEIDALSELYSSEMIIQDNVAYIVMDELSKNSLSEIIKEEKFSFTNQAIIACQLSFSIYYWHYAAKNPIIHADIKPSNVVVHLKKDGYPEASLIDLGLSLKSREKPYQHTAFKTYRGTPTYMAPEVALKHKISKSSDIYSLGVTFYKLFYKRIRDTSIFKVFSVFVNDSSTSSITMFCNMFSKKAVRNIIDKRSSSLVERIDQDPEGWKLSDPVLASQVPELASYLRKFISAMLHDDARLRPNSETVEVFFLNLSQVMMLKTFQAEPNDQSASEINIEQTISKHLNVLDDIAQNLDFSTYVTSMKFV